MKRIVDKDPDDEMDFSGWYDPDEAENIPAAVIRARVMKRIEKIYARRAWGEKTLASILGDLEPGATYHVLSGGDIDSLSYLMHILNSQDLDYCLFSTWCMARPIRNHGEPGDLVYDPFLGSGTTMVACENLKRRCLGAEISAPYCAVILQRMFDAFGITGERMA